MSDTITPTNLASSKMSFVTVEVGQTMTVDGTAKGVTYLLNGSPTWGGGDAYLTINDPKSFQGTIQMHGDAEVSLPGIIADSYNIKGDVLTLYDGNKVTDKITIDTDLPINVAGRGMANPTATSVLIGTGYVGAGFPELPLHT